ncbi:MAG: DNA polymerase Y family protein, partial [Actinomycetota bacterium]|nr:DNA polymerase Y family protein [Actinomycetota bacterium]
ARPAAGSAGPAGPWPGRLLGPAPAVVFVPPQPAAVRDADGAEPEVSGRGVLSAPPSAVRVGEGPWCPVEAWAGPWPVEERWWDGGRRRARLQVVAQGSAYLLARERGRWWVEAVYD